MKLRRLSALLGALALTFSATSAVLATAPVGHEVTICHANSDEKDPYVLETPDISQAGYNGDTSGHAGHGNDGVWYPGAKGDGFNWGDIIPPYDYKPNADTPNFHYDGLNWPEGQAIFENDCVIEPGIHVEKTASVPSLPVGGGSVTYTYVVTNTGNVPLTDVSVSDNKCSPVTYSSGDTDADKKLDLTESWTFTCTTTITVTTTNTGTATGDAGDTTVTDDDDATVTVTPHAPAIHVEKTASLIAVQTPGGPVTYTFVVTNTGNVPLTTVGVADNKCSPVTFVGGDTDGDAKLDLTESWTFTCTAQITQDTTNIGVATGHDGDTTVTDDDTVTVVLVGQQSTPVPAIHLEKTVDPLNLPAEGGKVTYTYVVSNIGDLDLTGVAVTDDNGTPDSTSDDFGVDCPKTTLVVDEAMTCTAEVTGTTVTTTNIATASGTGGETSVSDTDDATVTVAAPGGGVQAETDVPVAPQTDTGLVGDVGGTLPILLAILGIIGLAAVVLTPKRGRR